MANTLNMENTSDLAIWGDRVSCFWIEQLLTNLVFDEIAAMTGVIEILDNRFVSIHERSSEIVSDLSQEKLFFKPDFVRGILSCGEYVLRSAGKVEQTFGGITSRLWDDPFEWTLPEELSTVEKVHAYLIEVEKTRKGGFAFFSSESDLGKQLPTPEKMQTVFELLLETIVTAEKFQTMAVFVKEQI